MHRSPQKSFQYSHHIIYHGAKHAAKINQIHILTAHFLVCWYDGDFETILSKRVTKLGKHKVSLVKNDCITCTSAKHQVSLAPSKPRAGAYSARRGSTPSDSSLHKKELSDLTGMEIADKLWSVWLNCLAEALESQPRQISIVIEGNATSRFDPTKNRTVEEYSCPFQPQGCKQGWSWRNLHSSLLPNKNFVTDSQSLKNFKEFKQFEAEYNEVISCYKGKARDLHFHAGKLEVSSRKKNPRTKSIWFPEMYCNESDDWGND